MASRSNAPEGRESSPKATAQPAARQFLGKYELQRRIGSGGMGSVFLAFDRELKRTVALKVLPKEKAQNAVLVKRFKAEAQAAAHLRHENIVAVYDAGEADGYLYIALEYVDGTDLQNLVNKRGPLPVKRSIEIVKQVARALQHAHERNIVHRDIKPSNMLIASDGRMKLTDMGLARSVDETTETDITRAGTTVGTVDYMSPEQARNSRAADIRSDIYSLGCAWYQMLTGKPPFPEGSVTNKLHAHATQPPPDPREINSEVPEALVAVLHRMMAKSADKRYQTPQELLKDLENAYISREGVSAAVLAALAEDEAPRRPAGGGASSAAPPVLPPKGAPRRKQEAAEKEGRNLEPLKYLAIAAAVVGLIGFLYWISTGLSSVFDSSPNANDNPFATGETEGGGDVNAVQAVAPGSVKAKKFEPPEKSKQGPTIVKAVDTVPSADPPSAGKAGPESSNQQASRAYEESRLPDWLRKLAPPDEGSTPKGSAAKGSGAKGSAVRPPADLPVLTVGRVGDGPPSKFATLTAALAQVPDGGGMVQLVGDGPFVLTPTPLKKRRVVIAGAPGSRPVVLLVAEAGENGAGGALLSLSDGSLALMDVHLVAVADQLPPEGDVAFVEVAGGELAVVRSSATLIGTRGGSTAAFRIAGAAVPLNAAAPRCVIARTFVRGRGLTSVEIDAASVDFAASRSLFVTDQGPLLRVTNTGPTIGGNGPGPATGSPGTPSGAEHGSQTPERTLELVGCTLVSGGTAFELESGRSEPPATSVSCMDSIVAASGNRPGAVLASLENWPASDDGGSHARDLQWRRNAPRERCCALRGRSPGPSPAARSPRPRRPVPPWPATPPWR
jgi:serine/threonine-protein kinase